MSKYVSILVVVAMLSFGGQAYGQGTPLSFSAHGVNTTEIGTVPAGGFVLTNIIASADLPVTIWLVEGTNADPVVRVEKFRSTVDGIQISLGPGVPFDEGAVIRYRDLTGTIVNYITLTGYIPDPLTQSIIPAVGGVGFGILVATIAAAGGWILSRRRGFARAA